MENNLFKTQLKPLDKQKWTHEQNSPKRRNPHDQYKQRFNLTSNQNHQNQNQMKSISCFPNSKEDKEITLKFDRGHS